MNTQLELVTRVAGQELWPDKEVRVVGYGSMIYEPIEKNGWVVMPADMYEREHVIPVDGMRRINRLINAGVRIRGLLVADDGRKFHYLEPYTDAHRAPRETIKLPSVDWRKVFSAIGAVISVLAGIALAVSLGALVIGAIITIGGTLLTIAIASLVIGALAFDPVLIAVLDDGTYLAVYWWAD